MKAKKHKVSLVAQPVLKAQMSAPVVPTCGTFAIAEPIKSRKRKASLIEGILSLSELENVSQQNGPSDQ